MNSWIISGIILAIGFFICLILILRNKWKVRKTHIEDYEAGRNKLTPEIKKSQEKKEEVEQEYSGSGFSISSIIGGVVAILIGVSLIGPISETVKQVSLQTTATADASTIAGMNAILNIVPIFFTIIIVAMAIGLIYSSLRNSGLA
jgi:hypothetical protein